MKLHEQQQLKRLLLQLMHEVCYAPMLGWVLWCEAYNKWALREISPTHRDVPRIMWRLRDLRDTRARLMSR